MAPRPIPTEPAFRSSAERTLWRHLRGPVVCGGLEMICGAVGDEVCRRLTQAG